MRSSNGRGCAERGADSQIQATIVETRRVCVYSIINQGPYFSALTLALNLQFSHFCINFKGKDKVKENTGPGDALFRDQ